jgi:hypothetical protein
MKNAPGPNIWAAVTILLGCLIAYPFLRKSSHSGDSERLDENRIAGQGSASQQSAGSAASSNHKLMSARRVSGELPTTELSFQPSGVVLPEWARQSSSLDELISEGSPSQVARPALPRPKELAAWTDAPQASGSNSGVEASDASVGKSLSAPSPPGLNALGPNALGLDAGAGSYAFRQSSWGDQEQSSAMASRLQGGQPAWPDRQLTAEQRRDLLAHWQQTALAEAAAAARPDGDSSIALRDQVHRAEVGRSTIRAGPASNILAGASQSATPSEGPAGNGGLPAVISPDPQQQVPDRIKKYVYQPGYRPDD